MIIKTLADVEEHVGVYEPIRAFLPNGVMVLAYRSPNGLWWSSRRMSETPEDMALLTDFVAFEQPENWPGWQRLVPE